MLYHQHPEPLQIRHRCRHPRCGSVLKVPAANPRDAFCCRGCERAFYRSRCRVCEMLIRAKTGRPNRQLSRRSADASRVLSAMQAGACLHCSYERGRAIWKLSTGIFITQEVANTVTNSPHVFDIDDSLFPGHPGQTWRYAQ
jgi:hypothetical protein